jgi:hypothetical protein
MADDFAKLKSDGILSHFRWLFQPPRESIRLSALAIEAWETLGVRDFDNHIVVMTDDNWALSMFRKSPFTKEEVVAIWKRVEADGYHMLYWPRLPGMAGPDQYYNRIPAETAKTSRTSLIWSMPTNIIAENRSFVLTRTRFLLRPPLRQL